MRMASTSGIEQKDITIGIAMHKPYPVPHDNIYLPVHVGAALRPDILQEIQGDDSGDNISTLNPYFCELTALYWLWKNNTSQYKGLVHYRRYFTTNNWLKRHSRNRFERIIKGSELTQTLLRRSVVLPKKRHYVIETIYSHYAHTMYAQHLDTTIEVLRDLAPDYVDAWNALMRKRSAHIFNMLIMDREHFDAYCEWLFPILFELTSRLSPDQYDAFHARYPGRISEMLLNVWIMHNHIRFEELPTTFTERINWWKKGTGFLGAKFFKRKYTKSF